MKFICVVLFLMLLQLFGHGTSTSNINMDGVNVTGIALLRFNANLKPSTRNCRDHMWVLCSKDDTTPHTMSIVAGYDPNGDDIYIGRANYSGDLLPAKVIPAKRVANVSIGGKDIPVNDYEVLNGWRYFWTPSSNGDVPYGAVKCGRTSDGEILYCGRSEWMGVMMVGKVHPSQGGLYISSDGQEVKLTEYEILVQPESWFHTVWGFVYPELFLQGGFDADGDEIYVGRVSNNSDVIPAKVIPNKGGAFYYWSGREHKANSYEVLAARGFCWIVSENGNIPENAVPVGKTSAGQTLYVGRAEHEGSLSIGTIYPSQHFLYITFGGEEVRKESYEILVRI